MPPASHSSAAPPAGTIPCPDGTGARDYYVDLLRRAWAEFAPWSCYVRIDKSMAREDPDDGEWYIEGPLSDESPDIQGEEMAQGVWNKSGLRKGLATFFSLGGIVDVDHQYERNRDMDAICGQGVEVYDAPHPVTKAVVPWLKVKLIKAQKSAQKLWRAIHNGVPVGFSVAGGAIRKAGQRLLEVIITTVGVTAVPVQAKNVGTIRIAKAICEAEGYDGAMGDLDLPTVPQLWMDIEPIYRALQADPGLPHLGPGVAAAMVEDLGGQSRRRRTRKGERAAGFADAEDEDAELDRSAAHDDPTEDEEERRLRQLRQQGRGVRKALQYSLAEELAGALAGR